MDSSTNWWRPPEQPRPESKARSATTSRSLTSPDGYGLVFWALIGFTAVMLLGPQHRFPFLAPLRPALLSFGIAIVAYVYQRMSRGKPLIDLRTDVVLLSLLIAWAVLTLPFSM